MSVRGEILIISAYPAGLKLFLVWLLCYKGFCLLSTRGLIYKHEKCKMLSPTDTDVNSTLEMQ